MDNWRDLRYLAALTIPLSAAISIYFEGLWSYFTPVYAFVIIPILEVLLPQDTSNLVGAEKQRKENSRFFDWMLYLNLPIVYGLLGYLLWHVGTSDHAPYELVGLCLSLGIVLGVNGINVGHELAIANRQANGFWARPYCCPRSICTFT
nr:hypothetical protein [Allomuricauda sp.]|tara:strand:- start:614 stop:1060 length:447 start_codon:yes stop_codon:yes gene_type:complete